MTPVDFQRMSVTAVVVCDKSFVAGERVARFLGWQFLEIGEGS